MNEFCIQDSDLTQWGDDPLILGMRCHIMQLIGHHHPPQERHGLICIMFVRFSVYKWETVMK